MSQPTARRVAVAGTSAAVVAGMMLAGAPAGAAPVTLPFTNACAATAPIVGAVHKTAGSGATVDAPAAVDPGETFTYRIQPAGSSYPDSDSGASTTNISRLKIDYEIPANATFVSAAVVPGTGINLDGVAPSVLRVNTSGMADAAGTLLRLSGNNEVIANGANNNLKSEGGIRAPKLKKDLNGNPTGGESWFRLPAVDVTVTATGPGVITPKIRTAGTAGNYNANENYYTFLAKASMFGTQWAPTRCTPRDNQSAGLNAGAGALATITVADAGPTVEDTTTTLNVPGTAKTGTAVDLWALVKASDNTDAVGGTVQFKDNGTNIGGAIDLTDGGAKLAHTFAAAGAHSITATYSGANGFNASSGQALTVTVTDPAPVEVATTTTLEAPAAATTGTPVTLTATVETEGGDAVTTGTVRFLDGTTPIGEAIDVVNGKAVLAYPFGETGARQITATYTGATGFLESASAAATVTVTAPDGPVDPGTPGGGTGSLENIFGS